MTKVRLISALSILLLVSSCAHNRIRFVKAAPRQIESADNVITAAESDQGIDEVAYELEIKQEVSAISEKIISVNVDDQYSNAIAEPQDSTASESEPKISQEAFDEAMRTEKDSRWAKISLITAFPTLLIPGVGIIVSLVLFGVGCLFYSRSTRSRFNTARGQKDEETARKWRKAYLIFLGIVALLVATSLILVFIF